MNCNQFLTQTETHIILASLAAMAVSVASLTAAYVVKTVAKWRSWQN